VTLSDSGLYRTGVGGSGSTVLKSMELRNGAYLPTSHPRHDLGCCIDSAVRQRPITTDLLEAFAAKALHGAGDAIQRDLLAHELIADL
jgi:hypothetical protein